MSRVSSYGRTVRGQACNQEVNCREKEMGCWVWRDAGTALSTQA